MTSIRIDDRIDDRTSTHRPQRVRHDPWGHTGPRSPWHRRAEVEVRRAQLPERAADAVGPRLRVTAAAIALVALVVMVLAAPATVVVPLGIVLGFGVAVSAAVALVDRRTRDGARASG